VDNFQKSCKFLFLKMQFTIAGGPFWLITSWALISKFLIFISC